MEDIYGDFEEEFDFERYIQEEEAKTDADDCATLYEQFLSRGSKQKAEQETNPEAANDESIVIELYDDLIQRASHCADFQDPIVGELRQALETKNQEVATLQGALEELKKKAEALQETEKVLIRNISCLFRTAKLEIARKDAEIKGLKDSLAHRKGPLGSVAHHQRGRGRPSLAKPDAGDVKEAEPSPREDGQAHRSLRGQEPPRAHGGVPGAGQRHTEDDDQSQRKGGDSNRGRGQGASRGDHQVPCSNKDRSHGHPQDYGARGPANISSCRDRPGSSGSPPSRAGPPPLRGTEWEGPRKHPHGPADERRPPQRRHPEDARHHRSPLVSGSSPDRRSGGGGPRGGTSGEHRRHEYDRQAKSLASQQVPPHPNGPRASDTRSHVPDMDVEEGPRVYTVKTEVPSQTGKPEGHTYVVMDLTTVKHPRRLDDGEVEDGEVHLEPGSRGRQREGGIRQGGERDRERRTPHGRGRTPSPRPRHSKRSLSPRRDSGARSWREGGREERCVRARY